MTITNTTVSQTYQGNNSTTDFAIPFDFIDTDYIYVYLIDADGVETLQTITTHYTLTGGTTAQPTTVSMITPPASTETLRIERQTDITQETNYIQNGVFPAESHETALDKITQILQELYAKTGTQINESLGGGNDVQTEFTTSQTPISSSSVIVFLNGVQQRPFVDYDILGSTITFTTAPSSDQDVWVHYAY